jgi:serine protease AprX
VANTATGLPTYGNGTSYATPNIAGLTTCLWQAFPEYNNMAILDAMQRSATRFTNPDDRVGYGVPDMKKAFTILLKKSFTKQSSVANCVAAVQLNVKFDNTMNVVIERKQSNQVGYSTFKILQGTGGFTNKNISFTDDLALTSGGSINYRIRLDIVGDTSLYLDSLVINAPTLCTNPENKIAINPNPVLDIANVIISRSSETKITIILTSAAGIRLFENTYNQPAGTQIKTINMKSMSSGIYFVSVYENDKKIITKRIFKKNS